MCCGAGAVSLWSVSRTVYSGSSFICSVPLLPASGTRPNSPSRATRFFVRPSLAMPCALVEPSWLRSRRNDSFLALLGSYIHYGCTTPVKRPLWPRILPLATSSGLVPPVDLPMFNNFTYFLTIPSPQSLTSLDGRSMVAFLTLSYTDACYWWPPLSSYPCVITPFDACTSRL